MTAFAGIMKDGKQFVLYIQGKKIELDPADVIIFREGLIIYQYGELSCYIDDSGEIIRIMRIKNGKITPIWERE